ncbi:sigma-70 family RNA polymerase sigma factor [Dictyobacter arantiisoli]|uniref:Uncharacterized protein n=1 Tax=Dictyobacter arantiisoli TaxID=2014874 RepID=A0A5A5T608_9CHLR|nr:sigma-70 family RNA polymerase sigma factor [Dictyobacter arantiisoli]GCF06870.1 hypothetical protein KDI_04340 [Dictyobacter arantiisoli]
MQTIPNNSTLILSSPGTQRDTVLRILFRRAAEGEDVLTIICETLQPILKRMARRVAFTHPNWHLDSDDLQQEANVTVLAAFEHACTKDDPLSYILKAAKISMIETYISGRAELIKTNHTYQYTITYVSLDAPSTTDEGEAATVAHFLETETRLDIRENEHAFAWLRAAIDALPEKQRLVMQCHYELGETLNEISRRLSPSSPRPANAHYHHKRALHALHDVLAPLVLERRASDEH